MYCSHCGSLTASDLNFCKNCGKRNERNPLIVGNSSSRYFAFGAAMLGMVGIGGFFPILRELLRNQVDPIVMVILLIAYLITVMVLFSVMVGHVWKKSGDIRIKGSDQISDERMFYSRPVTTAQLPEPMDRPASVTEHTTRTLDEIPLRER
jgi:hypothetical protein